ncbi:MAG: ABC transporter substrate-binding protein [Deltaproteobacteria bacterium]|nr:ABC transporter substrate-binding protein [Deltaproteobacteria bacterium]
MDSVGWICAWTLGVLLFVFVTVGPGRAQPPKRVNIGHCQIAPEAMAVWVAKDQGIFAKYGLDVQLVFVVGDVRIVQVMLAGDIHVSACTLPGMIRSSARGGDTVVVAGLVNHLSFKLWTNASSPIRSVRDLKGKVIGISNLGATTHVVGQLILEEHGLSSKDVTFRGLGASPARLVGLERGLVDAKAEVIKLMRCLAPKSEVMAQ